MGKNEIENEEVKEEEATERSRPQRKTTYERKLKTVIPEEIVEHFAKDDWVIRYKPYRIANIVQNSALSELVRDGWLFVTSDEIPDWYITNFDIEDFRGRSEALVAHDLVLMKADKNLVESERQYYESLAQRELDSVNTNILEKRGFITKGSKSEVTMSEPRFRD